MKKLLALAALVLAGIALNLTHSHTSTRGEKPAVLADDWQAQSTDAPVVTELPPREPEPAVSSTAPLPDPRVQWLNTLYESPSVADKLEAARQIAALGNEAAFLELAAFIAAAEATGEDSLVDVTQQVAAILGQMRGEEIQTIATELAYSPSTLVAEAAVDAAVAAEPETNPQWFDSGLSQTPADQEALDAYLQQLADFDRKEVPPLPEN